MNPTDHGAVKGMAKTAFITMVEKGYIPRIWVSQSIGQFLDSMEPEELSALVLRIVSKVTFQVEEQVNTSRSVQVFLQSPVSFREWLVYALRILLFPEPPSSMRYNEFAEKRSASYRKAANLAQILRTYAVTLRRRKCSLRETTRVFEDSLKAELDVVKEAMVQRKLMSCESVRLWANAAALHVYMLILLNRLGDRLPDEVIEVAQSHEDSLQDIIDAYRVYKVTTVSASLVWVPFQYCVRFWDYETGKVWLPESTFYEDILKLYEGNVAIEYVKILFRSSEIDEASHFFNKLTENIKNAYKLKKVIYRYFLKFRP